MGKQYVVPSAGMVITEDTTFLPGVYYFFEQEGITIGADNITLDGNGAVFIGGKRKDKNQESQNTEEFSYGYSRQGRDDSLGYHGIAVYSKNAQNVTIKNLGARNFEIGLKLENCKSFKIHNNDFSYNYHNPDHGWDEHDDLGGIVLYHTHNCYIENNRANNVWNALTIRYSNQNVVKNNNFSHTSNVGLRLWLGCENEFYDNDFSWGIRKEPFEVHARDSSCVLIETGSNNNNFIRNDMRFGGDGLFIRSLNGWMSTGNYFEENDTSFANNNAIEAWDEGNTYVRNKANFSSYGFWLGNSDNTVLIENEVSYNGVNFKNAPENFGNAGISVVNGSGTNFRLAGNKIHHNHGPGIAIRNRMDYPSINWVIEENEIFDNKSDDRGFTGHGIYLKYARNINLINNRIYGNDGEALFMDEYVGDVKELTRFGEAKDIKVKIKPDSRTFEVDEEYVFSAVIETEHEGLTYKWDFSDGESYCRDTVIRKFDKPGFCRVSLLVSDGENISFDTIHVYVLSKGLEVLAEGDIGNWSIEPAEEVSLSFNNTEYVSREGSLMLHSTRVKEITLKYPTSENLGMDASNYSHFSFCLRYLNEMIDWYKENKTPVIRFYKNHEHYVEFTPKANLFSELANSYNESKYCWVYLEVNLKNDGDFHIKTFGNFDFSEINYMEIALDNQIQVNSFFLFSGMRFIRKEEHVYLNIVDVTNFVNDANIHDLVEVSSEGPESVKVAPLIKGTYFGDFTKRWVSRKEEGSESYQINFDSARVFDRVVIDFYESNDHTLNSHNEKLPKEMSMQYYRDGCWHDIDEGNKQITRCRNILTFNSVIGSKLRLILDGNEKPFSIRSIEVNNVKNQLRSRHVESIIAKDSILNIENIGVKLNYSLQNFNLGLSDLLVTLNEYSDDLFNSKEIASKELKWNDIKFKKETLLDLAAEGLKTGKKYFLGMTQKELANDMIAGQYYRWSGSGISEMDGTYGYLNKEGLVNNGKVGWGSNWIKIYTDRYVLDLSHNNDSLGNRFGLLEMEKIYQTFKLINPVSHLIEGSISGMNRFPIIEEDVIELTLQESCFVTNLVLNFLDESARSVEVIAGETTYGGVNNENITFVQVNSFIKKLKIHVSGNTHLKSIELL